MKKSTITDLPKDIESVIPGMEFFSGERKRLVQQIIDEARAGEFHDFKNKKYTCGKVQVVEMLTACKEPKLNPIIKAVIDGVYDESPDAEDKAMMKKDWIYETRSSSWDFKNNGNTQ